MLFKGAVILIWLEEHEWDKDIASLSHVQISVKSHSRKQTLEIMLAVKSLTLKDIYYQLSHGDKIDTLSLNNPIFNI